jgi:hypothetical protein
VNSAYDRNGPQENQKQACDPDFAGFYVFAWHHFSPGLSENPFVGGLPPEKASLDDGSPSTVEKIIRS